MRTRTAVAILLFILLASAPWPRLLGQSAEQNLPRLTACYAEKIAPEWRTVNVVIVNEPDSTWLGRSNWNVFHKTAEIQYNLAALGRYKDVPHWKVALHEVLHLVTAELYYIGAVYAPQERVYLEHASEGTVENIIAWPVWEGLCK